MVFMTARTGGAYLFNADDKTLGNIMYFTELKCFFLVMKSGFRCIIFYDWVGFNTIYYIQSTNLIVGRNKE